MIYEENRKNLLYYIFVVILFITPHLPMPTGVLGPIGPSLYLLLFGLFILNILKNPVTINLSNNYFKFLFLCQIILLLTDVIRILIFSPYKELNTALVRVVNLGVYVVCSYYFINYDQIKNYFVINEKLLRVFAYSVLCVSVVFYLQAFGIIAIGEVTPGRTFFGMQLPFKKPIGFVEISDGKIGTFIEPITMLFLVNIFQRLRFIKLKFDILIFILLVFIIIVLQSRSGYLAIFISFALFFILYPSSLSKLLKIASAGILIIFVTFFSDIYLKIWVGLTGEGIYEKNVDSRATTMKYAWDQFTNSPFYGVGHTAIEYETSLTDSIGAHNLFTDHLGSGGIISFLPLVLMFVPILYYSLKLYFLSIKINNTYNLGVSIWLITSMASIIVELNFYRGLYNEYVYLMLAIGAIAYLNYMRLSKYSL